MHWSFARSLLPRLERLPAPLLAGGCCAALLLALLAGFVPGRDGREVRLPLRVLDAESHLVALSDTRPLDTTSWMVRLPFNSLESFPHAPFEMDESESSLIRFNDSGVSFLTKEGPRHVWPQGESPDLFQVLNREANGLPFGLTFNYTAVVDGKDMPWCAPLTSQSAQAAGMRKAWLSGKSLPYAELVTPWLERFKLDRELFYAIMYTESGFNPQVISRRGAHGLMQIVPSTAGDEVYRYLFGKQGQPHPAELLTPDVNIKYGAAYLHLLHTRHMDGITDPLSREYCAVAAYNGGSGAVLKLFGQSRDEAFEAINSHSPAEIYDLLQQRLPSSETRKFLRKVLSLKNGLSLAAR